MCAPHFIESAKTYRKRSIGGGGDRHVVKRQTTGGTTAAPGNSTVTCTDENRFMSICSFLPDVGFGFLDVLKNKSMCLEDDVPNDPYGVWNRLSPVTASEFYEPCVCVC